MRIASVWNVKRKKQRIKVIKKPEIKKLKKLEKEITTLKELENKKVKQNFIRSLRASFYL